MIMDLDPHEAEDLHMPMSMPAPSTGYGAFQEKTRMGSNSNSNNGEEAKAGAVKKTVKYRECLKNHAASIGGHALDGCGEFMPCGEDGTMEALKCAACDCHRNFHRREAEGDPHMADCAITQLRKDHRKKPQPLPLPLPQVPYPLHRSCAGVIMALNSRATEMDDLQDAPGFLPSAPGMKKRFRTKFSSDQKEKMLVFAERLGWRIQRHDEAAVQEFCSEVGVKRHVLKVWMHNNKNTFSKKPLPPSPTQLI